jgi:hypothetical protein
MRGRRDNLLTTITVLEERLDACSALNARAFLLLKITDVECAEAVILSHRLFGRGSRDQGECGLRIPDPHLDVLRGDVQIAEEASVSPRLCYTADLVPGDLVDAHL